MATDIVAQMLVGQAGQRGQRPDSRAQLAARLLAEGASTAPVYSPMAGLARALTGVVGGWQGRVAEEADNARQDRAFQRAAEYQTQQRQANAAEVAAFMQQFGMGGGAPAGGPGTLPQAPPEVVRNTTPPPSAPPSGPVTAEPLPPPEGVPQRGEAPLAVSQGIAARRALDPNSPTYAQDIMRINDGVVAQTMPGLRMPNQPTVPTSAPAAPAAAPAGSASAAGPDWRNVALAATLSQNPSLQRLAPVAAQFANRDDGRGVTMGNRLVDPRTGRVIQEFQPEPDGTERLLGRWRELSSLGERATPAQQQERDMLGRRFQGGGTNVTVTNSADRSFADRLSEQAANRINELDTQAGRAIGNIERADRIADLLGQGVITGTGGEARLGIERALRTAGLIDGRRVATTEQLMTELATGTLEASGQLSGPTSDRDITFLREVAAGRIELTPETIARAASIMRTQNERIITRYNDAVSVVQRDDRLPASVREIYRPRSFPTRQAPAPNTTPAPAGRVIEYDAEGRRVTR
jgi:hypothetical protein